MVQINPNRAMKSGTGWHYGRLLRTHQATLAMKDNTNGQSAFAMVLSGLTLPEADLRPAGAAPGACAHDLQRHRWQSQQTEDQVYR